MQKACENLSSAIPFNTHTDNLLKKTTASVLYCNAWKMGHWLLMPPPPLSSNAWVVWNLKASLFVELSRAFSSVNKTKVLKCKFTWQSTMLPFSPTGNNYLYGHTQLLNKANVIITVILHGCVGTCQFSHTCLERNMRLLPVKAIRALEGQLCFQETRLLIWFHSFQITVV